MNTPSALDLPPLPEQRSAEPSMQAIRRILLMGFMGAGKSTVGRALALELGWSFLDLDQLIEKATGSTIPALFEIHGEAGFRREESRALVRALSRTNTVIALGGGAAETLRNRLLIEQTPGTCVLLLTADFSVLYDRCVLQALERGTPGANGAADRPNLTDPLAAQLRYQQRIPFYRRLATFTLETTFLSPAETITSALDLLRPALDAAPSLPVTHVAP